MWFGFRHNVAPFAGYMLKGFKKQLLERAEEEIDRPAEDNGEPERKEALKRESL